MNVHVSMIVRNESARHLNRCLASVQEILEDSGGMLLVTDDHSTDNTVEVIANAINGNKVHLQFSPEPLFWKNEGEARQRHLRFVDRYVSPGDWILALDADETVNRPILVREMAVQAEKEARLAVGMPLYEFWSETQHRTDGFWFGTKATRLYAWRPDGAIPPKPMGCGSEPTYVRNDVLTNGFYQQNELHLMHWGYLEKMDREAKHKLYTSREGGHGHLNAHVESIIGVPSLQTYQW